MENVMGLHYLNSSIIIQDPLFTFRIVNETVIMLAVIANLQIEEH